MLLTCRLLSQETFTIDVELSATVGEVKQKIEEKRGSSFKSDSLKLIYAGKVWDNNAATLTELNFIESGFVVVLINKPKNLPKNETATSSSSQPVDINRPSDSTPVTQNVSLEQPARPHAPAPVQQRPELRPEEAFGLSPEQYEVIVQEILQMGYPRVDVERALRASFFNADRAVEYLLNGLPQSLALGEEQAQQPADAQANQDALASFRTSPQLQQMRAFLQQDPGSLGRLLQDIAQTNPNLLRAIRDNQEDFLAMLHAPSAEGAQAGAVGGAEVAAGPRGSSSYIRVSPEEREAVERLKSLGFSESMVIEAYFACDKNEQHAANFLFSQLEEFEQGGSAGSNRS